jgi:hypothetical protein
MPAAGVRHADWSWTFVLKFMGGGARRVTAGARWRPARPLQALSLPHSVITQRHAGSLGRVWRPSAGVDACPQKAGRVAFRRLLSRLLKTNGRIGFVRFFHFGFDEIRAFVTGPDSL